MPSLPSIPSIPGLPSAISVPGLPSISGLPSIPGLPTGDALKKIAPPDLTSSAGLLDATKSASASGFSAISGSLKALKGGVPQNLTAINLKNKLEQTVSDTKADAPASADAFTKGLSNAGVDLKTGKIPAVDAALASGGLGAGMSALSGTMKGVPGMSGMASINPSTMASGLSNLPGGQSAVSSLVNSTTGSTSGVSDTLGGLNLITKNASSAALNGISSATAGSSAVSGLVTGGALTGAGSSLAGALNNPAGALSIPSVPGMPSVPGLPSVDSLKKGLETGKQPLSSLATTGLSAAAAASLTASMNSISTSSPNPIKMPTVAVATVDRSEVSGQVTSLLGDKKIPAPDFNATPTPPSPLKAQVKEKRLEFITKKIAYDEEKIARTDAIMIERAKYEKIRDSLPEGDPVRIAARTEVNAKIAAYTAWWKGEEAKLNVIREEVNQLQQSEGQAAFNETSVAARAKV
jgi:integrin beta 8